MRCRSARAIATALAAACSATATASTGEQNRAELIGVLTLTRLSVSFDGVQAREAFKALSAALRTTIIGRYRDDPPGTGGIIPDLPVTFSMEDVPARYVLELILDQVALDEPCTWQLRTGYIEVGTKERLGVPAAAETRLYPVTDLLLEAPYFANPFAGGGFAAAPVTSVYQHPYATAALSRPVPFGRKVPSQIQGEIARGIVELIEPGNWDYGQFDGDPNLDDPLPGSYSTPPRAGAPPPGGKIARLRIWRDVFVISAPDYMHRQIAGYPRPIAPPALTEAERLSRSKKASSEHAQVTVLAVGERGDR